MEQTKIQEWKESQEYQDLGDMQEAFGIWLNYYACDDTSYFDHDINRAIEKFEEAYQGEFESELDFGMHLADETMLFNIPQSVLYYFDYEAFTRDIFIDDYIFIDGYVFIR